MTWFKPCFYEDQEGKITTLLQHNGIPYKGSTVSVTCGATVEADYLRPFWMTSCQAKELGAHVKKGERGNLVVCVNLTTKLELHGGFGTDWIDTPKALVLRPNGHPCQKR